MSEPDQIDMMSKKDLRVSLRETVKAFLSSRRECNDLQSEITALREENGIKTRALQLAKDMILANGLDIPQTMIMINEALGNSDGRD